MIRKHAFAFLMFFTVSGLLVSLYAIKQHYAPLGSSACNISETFNCDLVNHGPYSEILGFPVAAIGLIGYVMIGAVALQFRKTKDPVLGKILLALFAGGVAFSLYLSSLEEFVIGAWCLICLASLSCIVGASLSGLLIYKQFLKPASAAEGTTPTAAS
jgi:uncharacterized membrane protein